MMERKPYCFVETPDLADAEKIAAVSGEKVQHDGINTLIQHHICFIESGWFQTLTQRLRVAIISYSPSITPSATGCEEVRDQLA